MHRWLWSWVPSATAIALEPTLIHVQVNLTANWKHLAVVQTSWSCQSKCQRLRAALLVHNFPLSWIYVKHVHRVVLLLNRLCRGLWFYSFSPSSYLNFDLSIVAMQFLRCGQIQRKLTKVQSCDRCNLKTCLVTFAAYLMREGFFTQGGQKLTELGVAKCHTYPWTPEIHQP